MDYGLSHRICRAAFCILPLLLPDAFFLWIGQGFHVEPALRRTLGVLLSLLPLHQEIDRNHIRSSILTRDNAAEEYHKELLLLLGVCSVDRVLHQSPAVHSTLLWKEADRPLYDYVSDL